MELYAKAYPVFSRTRGFYSRRFQDMLWSLGRFSKTEVAQQRMKIIKFYEEYGEKTTKEAFRARGKLLALLLLSSLSQDKCLYGEVKENNSGGIHL